VSGPNFLEDVVGGQAFSIRQMGLDLLAARWNLARRCVSIKSNTNAEGVDGGMMDDDGLCCLW
jgi:hypothetical protein